MSKLDISKLPVQMANEFARLYKYKIIYMPFPVGGFLVGKWDINAGNADVVNYIKNAEIVLTDSFHGTLLTIIYNKQFFTYSAGTHSNVGARINDMLKHYGLESRKLDKDSNLSEKVDYRRVNEILREDRETGYRILGEMTASHIDSLSHGVC